MTLTQCDQNDQLNSNRDCPNLDVVNEFKLEQFPTRTEFHLYPQNPSATMVSQSSSGGPERPLIEMGRPGGP